MSQVVLIAALTLGVTILDPEDVSEVAPRPGAAPADSIRVLPGGSRSWPEPLPRLGEYVYVEQLPEAIAKVPPVYPAGARLKRVSGTVVVKALVGKDGRIKEMRVFKSIPELDDSAIEAVKRWRFKPAMSSEGQPLAVWVAIPVKFSLR